MRVRAWRWVLGAAIVTAGGGSATARADMIYFKNGTSLWGEDAWVERDEVVIYGGGRTLRFPAADVDRIEKKRTNLPDYHVTVPPPPAVPEPPAAPPGPSAPPGAAGSSPSGSSGSGGSRRY